MLPQDSLRYGKEGNLIREIAGYAAARAAEIGAENVFNFSIGNPNVAAPDVVAQTLRRLLDTMPSVELHRARRLRRAAGHRRAPACAVRRGLQRG